MARITSIITQLSPSDLQQTMWSISTKVLTMLLFYALQIFLARYLGVELYAGWTYFYSIFTILVVCTDFGLNESIKVFVARSHPNEQGRIIVNGVFLRFFLTTFFSILIFIFSPLLVRLLSSPHIIHDDTLLIILRISAIAIILFHILDAGKKIVTAIRKLSYLFIITTIEHVSKLIIVFLFTFSGLTIQSIVYAHIFAFLLAAFYSIFVVYSLFFKEKIAARIQKNNIKELVQYSIPLVIISIGMLITTEVDTLMLGRLSSTNEVAYYGVTKSIITKIPQISFAIAMATMPIFAVIHSKNIIQRKQKFFSLLKLNGVIIIPIATLLAIAAPFIIVILFGEEYRLAENPLRILSIYLIMYSFSVFYSLLLNYQKLASKRARNHIIGILLNILLNIILIPKYGATGAAIGTTLSYIPYFILNIFEAHHHLHQYEVEIKNTSTT